MCTYIHLHTYIQMFEGLANISGIINQRYTGDVTIIPDVDVSDCLKLLSNPSDAYLEKCTKISMKSTWKHISQLQGLCTIEFCLDECLQGIRKQIQQVQQQLESTDSQHWVLFCVSYFSLSFFVFFIFLFFFHFSLFVLYAFSFFFFSNVFYDTYNTHINTYMQTK